jgi:hypothetical protein
MDPLTEAHLRLGSARIRRDKKAIRRAEKAIERLENPSLIRQWMNYWYEKLRPQQKSAEQHVVDEIVNALRKRGRAP